MVLRDYSLAAPGSGTGRRRLERRLAAILVADIMGYSALMERDEDETHAPRRRPSSTGFAASRKSHGRVFSFTGDGLMAEFPSAVEALKCALRVQTEAGKRNARLPDDRKIIFRIGLNSVSCAAEGTHRRHRGDYCGSPRTNRRARRHLPVQFRLRAVRRIVTTRYEFLGDQRLKNIRDPVAVYSVRAASCSTWPGMPALPRLTGSAIPDAGPAEQLSNIGRHWPSFHSEPAKGPV